MQKDNNGRMQVLTTRVLVNCPNICFQSAQMIWKVIFAMFLIKRCSCKGRRHEACHNLCINKREPLKVCQQVLRVKEELKIGPSEFDFAESTVIFISESFCSYYKTLRSKCNKIQERKLVPSYFTSNGNIRYRIRKTLVSIQSITSQVF